MFKVIHGEVGILTESNDPAPSLPHLKIHRQKSQCQHDGCYNAKNQIGPGDSFAVWNLICCQFSYIYPFHKREVTNSKSEDEHGFYTATKKQQYHY
jgi:hypothetical protein